MELRRTPRAAGGLPAWRGGAYPWAISTDAYSDLVAPLLPGATLLPLPAGLGSTFIDPQFEYEDPRDAVTGRIALLVTNAAGWGSDDAVLEAGDGGTVATLVVESRQDGVACPLTKGQLHRLTNALSGRGTRSGVRPTATTGGFVHLTGSPERLIVEYGDWRVEVPAGPRRVLGWALRNAEVTLPQ